MSEGQSRLQGEAFAVQPSPVHRRRAGAGATLASPGFSMTNGESGGLTQLSSLNKAGKFPNTGERVSL